VVGPDCIIGAKSLVAEDKVIPPGSLVLGVPGRVVRALTAEDLAYSHDITARYVLMAQRHRGLVWEG
jgi:carbonic anhydrase/acetyltransferase-like protein (isoleucine patch superfamily)